MKTIAALLLSLATSSAYAEGDCFALQDDPTWTITEDGKGGFQWKQGEKIVSLETSGAGTGISVRVAYDENGDGYRYMYHKGDLIIEMEIYEPGCD